jgi:hypothetical protein
MDGQVYKWMCIKDVSDYGLDLGTTPTKGAPRVLIDCGTVSTPINDT